MGQISGASFLTAGYIPPFCIVLGFLTRYVFFSHGLPSSKAELLMWQFGAPEGTKAGASRPSKCLNLTLSGDTSTAF